MIRCQLAVDSGQFRGMSPRTQRRALCDLSFERLFKPIEKGADFITLRCPNTGALDESDQLTREDAGLQLTQASHANAHELKKLASRPSPVPLRDVRRNRNSGSTHLGDQPISLSIRQQRGHFVDRLAELHGLLPNDEILKTAHLIHREHDIDSMSGREPQLRAAR